MTAHTVKRTEYMMTLIVENFTRIAAHTVKPGTVLFLARHGKNLYFTDEIDDKCIFRFETKDEAIKFYQKRENDIKAEIKVCEASVNDLCISYMKLVKEKITELTAKTFT